LFCGPTPFECTTPATNWVFHPIGGNISFCSEIPGNDCLPVIFNF
jgi:hypothetical protein